MRSDARPCCQREIADSTLAVTSPGYLQAVLLQYSDLPHTHTHTHAHTDEHTLLLVQYPRWMHTHGVTFHPSNTPEQIISVHVSATHSGMPVTLSVNLSHIYMKLLTREIYPFPPAVAAAALICSQCSLDPWMNPRCSFGIMIRHTAYAETMTCPTYTITNDEWNLENRFFGGEENVTWTEKHYGILVIQDNFFLPYNIHTINQNMSFITKEEK